MKVHRATRLALTLAAVAIPAGAGAWNGALRAQAFGLNEVGSCAIGRAFATTASPCLDASTIYWNPAAATWLSGWSATAGVSAISIKARFTQDTTRRAWNATTPTQWVPDAFINYHSPSSKAAFGVGFYVPYGLTSEWPSDFPGRFSASKVSLRTFYIQPNIAWQITPQWSIGGGPVYGHSAIELNQAVDLSAQVLPTGQTFAQIGVAAQTQFAQVHLTANSNAWGAQIAVSGRPSPAWSLGLRFLTPLEFKFDNGTATFTQVPTNLVIGGNLPGPTPQTTIPAGTPIDVLLAPQFAAGGPLVTQQASTKVTHPAQIQAGIAYSGYRNWLLEADYFWAGWKRFNVLPITFAVAPSRTLIENFNNSSGVRLGAEYTIPTGGWKLRGGFAAAASAAPPETVTPLLPEQDRSYWTFGAGIPLLSRWTLDASYAHIGTGGARGRIIERTSQNASLTADQLNSGVYNLSANIFSFSLKASF